MLTMSRALGEASAELIRTRGSGKSDDVVITLELPEPFGHPVPHLGSCCCRLETFCAQGAGKRAGLGAKRRAGLCPSGEQRGAGDTSGHPPAASPTVCLVSPPGHSPRQGTPWLTDW